MRERADAPNTVSPTKITTDDERTVSRDPIRIEKSDSSTSKLNRRIPNTIEIYLEGTLNTDTDASTSILSYRVYKKLKDGQSPLLPGSSQLRDAG